MNIGRKLKAGRVEPVEELGRLVDELGELQYARVAAIGHGMYAARRYVLARNRRGALTLRPAVLVGPPRPSRYAAQRDADRLRLPELPGLGGRRTVRDRETAARLLAALVVG